MRTGRRVWGEPAAAEQEDEELIKKAGAAERKAKPTNKKPGRNPDDE